MSTAMTPNDIIASARSVLESHVECGYASGVVALIGRPDDRRQVTRGNRRNATQYHLSYCIDDQADHGCGGDDVNRRRQAPARRAGGTLVARTGRATRFKTD